MPDLVLQNESRSRRVLTPVSGSDTDLMMRVVMVGMFCFPLMAVTMPERDSPISFGSIDALAFAKLLALLSVVIVGSLVLIQQWLQARTRCIQESVLEEPSVMTAFRAFFPYLVFLSWAILSVTWSARVSISLGQAGGLTSLLIIGLLVARVASRDGGVERVLKCLSVSLLVLSVLLLFIHLSLPGLSGLDRRMLIAGEDGIVHPTAASANASLGLLIAVCCLFIQRYGWAKQMLIAAICIHGTVLILASSRAAWGMTLVTIPMCLFLTGDNCRRAWIGLTAGVGILAQMFYDPGFHSFSQNESLGVSYMMRGQSITQLKAIYGQEEM